MRELALFAGIGGGILGSKLLGWSTRCAVEINPYCREVLLARQRDGYLPSFPIWDDVRNFDGRPWRNEIDVISGGFSCRDSAGISGSSTILWGSFARIVDEIWPDFVVIESSQDLRVRGLVTILQDLADMGYNARWGVLGAAHVGAPHFRQRMWVTAHSNNAGKRMARISSTPKFSKKERNATDADSIALRWKYWRSFGKEGKEKAVSGKFTWWPSSVFKGVHDGTSHRMDRFKSTGNAQVPAVAALAWKILAEGAR